MAELVEITSEVCVNEEFKIEDKVSLPTASEINALLESLYNHIAALSRKKVPRIAMNQEIHEYEVDDLMQNVLIKLWLALEKQQIIFHKSYINLIVRSQVVEMVRRRKPVLRLVLNEEGDPFAGHVLIKTSEDLRNPAEVFEQDESQVDCLEILVEELLGLPARQQHAMICALNDHLESTHPLLRMLSMRGIDIESIHWPGDKHDLQCLQSSLSIARRRLRTMKGYQALKFSPTMPAS